MMLKNDKSKPSIKFSRAQDMPHVRRTILSLSHLSTSTTMSLCQCSRCFPSRARSIKTIQQHLNADKDLLNSSGHSYTRGFAAHLQNCIDLNTRCLESLGSSDEGKPAIYITLLNLRVVGPLDSDSSADTGE